MPSVRLGLSGHVRAFHLEIYQTDFENHCSLSGQCVMNFLRLLPVNTFHIGDTKCWVPALFRDKRIKFNFGRDNGIKFNISIRIKDKIKLCRIMG